MTAGLPAVGMPDGGGAPVCRDRPGQVTATYRFAKRASTSRSATRGPLPVAADGSQRIPLLALGCTPRPDDVGRSERS
jgi:hypothetical protein